MRNALHHAAVFNVLGEHGFDVLLLDLADDVGHGLRRRLCFRAHALRREEGDVVAFGHVTECVVSRQHFAAGNGNGAELLAGVCVQLHQLLRILAEAGLVITRAGRVGLDEGLGDIGGIFLHQNRVVPYVRVEFAVVVMMVVFVVVMVMIVVMMMVVSAGFERRNACAGLDKRHFALLHGTHDIGFFQA